jgi:thiamine biosynthesis lipoprotein
MGFNFIHRRLAAHRDPEMALTPLIPLLHLLTLLAATDLGSAPASDLGSEGVTLERETFVMGTRLRAMVRAVDAEAAKQAIEAAFGELRRLEAVLSSWRSDSELGRVNEAEPGVPVEASAELLGLLAEVRRWSERTAGAFDPAVGALIDAWDLRGSGRRPGEAERLRALEASGWGAFELDAAGGTVTRRQAAAWLTAGGFGKGAGLRAAAERLRESGVEGALLDFGGQLLAMGSPSGQTGWRIGVAHPSRRGEEAAAVGLIGASVATSGASERFVEVDGRRWGHILDPRTGRPAPAWGSVTVIASDALVADLLSTALFVLGPIEGLALARSWDDVGVLFLVESTGELRASWNRAMQPWLVAVEGKAIDELEELY